MRTELDPMGMEELRAQSVMIGNLIGGLGYPPSAVSGVEHSVEAAFKPLFELRTLMGPGDIACPGQLGVRCRSAMQTYRNDTLALADKQLKRVLAGKVSDESMPAEWAVNVGQRTLLAESTDLLLDCSKDRKKWGTHHTAALAKLHELVGLDAAPTPPARSPAGGSPPFFCPHSCTDLGPRALHIMPLDTAVCDMSKVTPAAAHWAAQYASAAIGGRGAAKGDPGPPNMLATRRYCLSYRERGSVWVYQRAPPLADPLGSVVSHVSPLAALCLCEGSAWVKGVSLLPPGYCLSYPAVAAQMTPPSPDCQPCR